MVVIVSLKSLNWSDVPSKKILVKEDFLASRTGKALYDENTKLWCNGPSYLVDLYNEEKENKARQ